MLTKHDQILCCLTIDMLINFESVLPAEAFEAVVVATGAAAGVAGGNCSLALAAINWANI